MECSHRTRPYLLVRSDAQEILGLMNLTGKVAETNCPQTWLAATRDDQMDRARRKWEANMQSNRLIKTGVASGERGGPSSESGRDGV